MDTAPLLEHAKRLRRQVIEKVYTRKSGHTGGALSIVDILVTLYDLVLTPDDLFILSKGHACLPYFFILEERGFKPTISGHPERDPANGILCTTGSLGHGLPQSVGLALGKKMKRESGRIFVLMSDAECQEGTTWESLLLATHHKLDNLVIIVDNNKLQTLGKTSDILSLGDLGAKTRAFGVETISCNGHSFENLMEALSTRPEGTPLLIIADTVKGKGVSFMEGVSGWHTLVPTEQEYVQAMKELQ